MSMCAEGRKANVVHVYHYITYKVLSELLLYSFC